MAIPSLWPAPTSTGVRRGSTSWTSTLPGRERRRNRHIVFAIAAAVDVPVQVGGGIRSDADAQALLDHGVERVVLGTAALETPELVETLAARYPGRVAVGLDHRGAELAVRGWERPSGTTLDGALDRLAPLDLGAVVVTAIARDGMLAGPDVEGLAAALARSAHPVVASGGVRSTDDLRRPGRAARPVEDAAATGRGHRRAPPWSRGP